ncbi:hypothetical protein TNCV_3437521 [Trichonephila clavipes]|nr:hypothetical protein TNCV_3437521 [Trichonephila clavipes]
MPHGTAGFLGTQFGNHWAKATDVFYGVSERPASGALTKSVWFIPQRQFKSGPHGTLFPAAVYDIAFSSVRRMRRASIYQCNSIGAMELSYVHPYSIVVSEANCSAVDPEFESRGRH